MPLVLADRAFIQSPTPLTPVGTARMLRTPVYSTAYTRVRRGVYAEKAAWSDLRPWERYAARVHAFILTNPDAVLCLESAAVILGLPIFGEPRHVHVFAPQEAESRRAGDVAFHTSVDPRDIVQTAGILTTSMADTVVDLARTLPPAFALAVADAALSPALGGNIRLHTLRALTRAQKNSRGRRRLRWTWDNVDERAESPAESISRAVIAWSGFETPELQREFQFEGHDDRVDFYFPSADVIGEADGWQKYGLMTPDAAAKALADEKRREDRLRRHVRGFARWEYANAMQVEPLMNILGAAGVRRVRQRDDAMLATLYRNPRSF